MLNMYSYLCKMNTPLVEVCVESLVSARAAHAGGAGRIELCDRLDLGGLTPATDLIRQVKREISIKLHVLIRPREGNFNYSHKEYQKIQDEIRECKDLGVDGIVIGILLPDGSLDVERMSKILELATPLSTTFHRAFDEIKDPANSVKQIINLGMDRILSSGQQPEAPQGSELLQKMIVQAGEELIIMPGAGLNTENITEFAREIRTSEYHGSLRIRQGNSMETTVETVQKFIRNLNLACS